MDILPIAKTAQTPTRSNSSVVSQKRDDFSQTFQNSLNSSSGSIDRKEGTQSTLNRSKESKGRIGSSETKREKQLSDFVNADDNSTENRMLMQVDSSILQADIALNVLSTQNVQPQVSTLSKALFTASVVELQAETPGDLHKPLNIDIGSVTSQEVVEQVVAELKHTAEIVQQQVDTGEPKQAVQFEQVMQQATRAKDEPIAVKQLDFTGVQEAFIKGQDQLKSVSLDTKGNDVGNIREVQPSIRAVDVPQVNTESMNQHEQPNPQDKSASQPLIQTDEEGPTAKKISEENVSRLNPFDVNLVKQAQHQQELQEVSQAVEKAVARFESDFQGMHADTDSIRIALEPKELGSMTITLVSGTNGLTAKITTDNQDAASLIGDQIHRLIQTMEQKGVRIENVDVVFSQMSGGDMGGHSHADHSSHAQAFIVPPTASVSTDSESVKWQNNGYANANEYYIEDGIGQSVEYRI